MGSRARSGAIIRQGGLLAIVGGLFGVLLTPVVAAAGYNWWGRHYSGWEDDVPLLIGPLRFWVEPFLGMAPPDDVYPTYGRLFLFVFLSVLAGLVALGAVLGGRAGKTGSRGLRLAVAGIIMNLAGNVGDYWLGEKVLHQPLWGMSFAIGTLLGYLIYGVGTVLLGTAIVRTGLLPAWAGWSLIISPPLGLLLLFWGVIHIPSGMVWPMSAAWVVTGASLLTRDNALAGQRVLANGQAEC